MLQETESDRAMRFKLAAVNFLNSHHLGHFDYMPMETKHGAAVGGLLALRAAASNSVPTLLRMLHRNNCNPLPEEIPFILAFIGPPAEAAIPMLIEKVSLTNALGRYNSLLALGQIHGRPELSVPVLVKCLEDPDIMFRRAAAWGLQAFGPEARTAEPALAHLVPAWSPTNRAATKAQLGIKSSDPQLEWELMVAADNALAAVHGQ
jgi:HEAT repeat protein